MRESGLVLALVFSVMQILSASCGRDTGYLYEDVPVQHTEPLGEYTPLNLTPPYELLTWHWDCPESPESIPAPPAYEVLLRGEGPHNLPRERVVGTPLVFKGRICPPAPYKRDIVIGIDVSGSMGFSDTGDLRSGNSCKRLEALEGILASLPADARIALFTFEETTPYRSTQFFSTKDELYADIAAGGSAVADVVCDAGGLSDFNVVMQSARDLFQGSRAGAVEKELYLITDGNPTVIAPDEGLRIAREMTRIGIEIATKKYPVILSGLRVANVDAVLKQIVTNDRQKNPLLARIEDFASIVQRAGEWSVNNLATATLRFRVIGSEDWQETDLMPMVKDFAFTMPERKLAITSTQTGWEVEFEYWDDHRNLRKHAGELLWLD